VKPISLAIISATGTGQKRTIPALADSGLVTVSAIHGRDVDKLAHISDKYQISAVYTDENRMLDEATYDAVMICSPPHLHVSQALPVIKRGIPCLIEKPAAMTLAECEELKRAAEQENVTVHVAHHLRHQDTYVEMQKAISTGEIGQVVAASAEWSFKMNRSAPSTAWKLDPAKNGDSALNDAGIHCVDAILGLLGPGTVQATASGRLEGDRTAETVDVLLGQSSCLTHIRSSRLYGPFQNDLRINGTAGHIVARNFFTETSSEVVDITTDGDTRSVRHTSGNPYATEVEDFARAIRGVDPEYAVTNLNDACQAMTIVESVHEALATGKNLDSKGD
jgi:predicted dehydrogenase